MTFDNFELYLCSVPLLLSGKQVFLGGQILLFSCENKLLVIWNCISELTCSDNIHTHPEEGHWESHGGGDFSKD